MMLDREKTRQALEDTDDCCDEHTTLRSVARAFVDGRLIDRETLDWTSAAEQMGMIVRGVLKFGPPAEKHDTIDSQLEGHWAGRVVGAAVGRVEHKGENA